MKIRLFVWQISFLKSLYLILWIPITGFQKLVRLQIKLSATTNMQALSLHAQDIVSITKWYKTKTLLSDFNFPCKIEKWHCLVCMLTTYFFCQKWGMHVTKYHWNFELFPFLLPMKPPLKELCVWEFFDLTAC